MVQIEYSKKFLKLLNKVAPGFLEKFWNEKWKQSRILFNTGRGFKDVRMVFQENPESKTYKEASEAYQQALAEVLETTQGWDLDYKFDYIVQYVRRRIKYKRDNYLYDKPEWWATPGETLLKGAGDCEDGAILIVALARDVGIPAFRVKMAGGWVKDPFRNGRVVGHAYPIFLREKFNDWFTGDWCYYPSKSKTRFWRGVPHKYADEYGEIWWTTNWERTWLQHSTKWDYDKYVVFR